MSDERRQLIYNVLQSVRPVFREEGLLLGENDSSVNVG